MRAVLRHALPAIVVALLFAPSAARAHSNSVDSDPADDSTISVLPKTASVTFNEPVSKAALALTGPDATVTKLRPTIDGTVISAALPANGAKGAYVLAYRVVSEDGHPVTGEIEFTVATGAAASGTHAPTPADRAQASGFPVGVVVGGAVILLGAAVLLLRAART